MDLIFFIYMHLKPNLDTSLFYFPSHFVCFSPSSSIDECFVFHDDNVLPIHLTPAITTNFVNDQDSRQALFTKSTSVANKPTVKVNYQALRT